MISRNKLLGLIGNCCRGITYYYRVSVFNSFQPFIFYEKIYRVVRFSTTHERNTSSDGTIAYFNIFFGMGLRFSHTAFSN